MTIGWVFGDKARHELLWLAIPRRVYTQSHIDCLVGAIRGFEIEWEPKFPRHFSARFRPT